MTQNDLKASIEKRLASYGAMSLAVASGFVATPASGAVIFTDTSTWSGNSTTSGPVYFNPMTGTFGTSPTNEAFNLFHLSATASSGARLILSGLGSANGAANGPGGFLKQFAFSSQVSNGKASFVGGGRLEASSLGVHFGNFNTGDAGYLGLRENGNYGWAHVQILSGYHAKLLGFSIQTAANTPISGSDSPEPSSLVLLALGAAGIAAYRRKAVGSAAAK